MESCYSYFRGSHFTEPFIIPPVFLITFCSVFQNMPVPKTNKSLIFMFFHRSSITKKTLKSSLNSIQKQPSGGVLRKRCSENIHQIYRRTTMPKCDFNKVAEITSQHGCSPVNLLHIVRIPFHKNTSGWLLLCI